MATLSTHVLDLDRGKPADGMAVAVYRDGASAPLGSFVTDADGRVAKLPLDGVPSTYRIDFAVGRYFAARNVAAFYDVVTIAFRATEPDAHYHVPLLLSPFGYSTYRGS